MGLVSTLLVMYMMVAPLATTVSANASAQSEPAQTQAQDQRFSKEDMEQRAKACYEHHKNDENYNLTPLEVVKSCASELGFDVQNDTFILILENQNIAIVQVIHDGNSYNVSVVRSDHEHCWVVSSID